MTYSVFNIANWFLSKSPLTHKKLQKLCYYAQAWHSVLYDAQLFEEEIQAWVHGPVIPELYKKYADYGWNDIPQTQVNDDNYSDDILNTLEAVYNTYGQFNGDQLESLTHSEEPWKKARGNLNAWEPCTNIIPLTDLKDYYKKIHVQAQGE